MNYGQNDHTVHVIVIKSVKKTAFYVETIGVLDTIFVSLFSRSVLVAVNNVIIQDDDHTFFQIIKRVPVVPRTYI